MKVFKYIIVLFIFFGCSGSAEISEINNNGNTSNGDGDKGNDSSEETSDPTQSNFYLSSQGDDSNTGTIDKPWKTLLKLSNKKLSPGDSIFFKSGDSFVGQLIVQLMISHSLDHLGLPTQTYFSPSIKNK